MRRLFTYFICAVFFFSLTGDLAAVEKKKKKETAKKTVQQKADSSQPVKKSLGKKQRVPKSAKKYDTFIDKNKNGIDDRRERLKPKTLSKPPTKKKSTARKKGSDKKPKKK